MKTLRNKNRKPVKHKSNKNRRRHTHKNRKPKKRTSIRKKKSGGFWKPNFLKTTKDKREESGDQAPILELFQQIHKTYITWPGSKDYAKHKFHMAN